MMNSYMLTCVVTGFIGVSPTGPVTSTRATAVTLCVYGLSRVPAPYSACCRCQDFIHSWEHTVGSFVDLPSPT